MNLTNSLGWNTINQVGNQILTFIFAIILVRLLPAEHFGMMSMLLVVTGFVNLFTNSGFFYAIIQNQNQEKSQLSSIFWLNIVIGIILSAIIFFSAGYIAQFYQVPRLESAARVLSAMFLLSSIWMVPYAILQKNFQLKQIALIEMISTAIGGCVGVSLALSGAGFWSLIIQLLITVGLKSILTFVVVDWTPTLHFNIRDIFGIWRYVTNVFSYNFVNYWSLNTDNLLIGRIMGSTALGYYSRAYSLMLLPTTQLIGIVGQIMITYMSKIQDDTEALKKLYLQTMSVLVLGIFPLMLGLLATAEPFVIVVFGEAWLPMVPVLRILTLIGALQSLLQPVTWIYLSQDRTDLLFKQLGLLWSFTIVIGIVIGVMLGTIETVATFYALANAIILIPVLRVSGRILNISLQEIFRTIRGAIFAAVFMSTLVFLVDIIVLHTWSAWLRFIILVSIGAITYIVTIFSFQIHGTDLIQEQLIKRFPNSPFVHS